MFKVEKNIPIPQKTHLTKYPFYSMEIGDSFETEEGRVRQAAFNYAADHPEYKFKSRKTEIGFRVWRVSVEQPKEYEEIK